MSKLKPLKAQRLTKSLLRRAKKIIRERGWTQHTSGSCSDNDPVCLQGALAIALGRKGWTDTPHWLDQALMERLDGQWAPIWNDDEGRTRGQVLRKLTSWEKSL